MKSYVITAVFFCLFIATVATAAFANNDAQTAMADRTAALVEVTGDKSVVRATEAGSLPTFAIDHLATIGQTVKDISAE